MRKMREKIFGRLKAVAAVVAAMVVAVAIAAGGAQVAQAAEPTYASTPIPGVATGPGFEWVEATATEPAHYRVYNPIEEEPLAHESVSGWWRFAQASREHDFSGYLVTLDTDLDFSKYDWTRNGEGRTELTIGLDEDAPFKGTFDGRSHTMRGLRNEREGVLYVADCGLFGVTRDAVIKNLTLDDIYVGASTRSGVLVGYAQDTFILNVTCINCTSSVIPGNNVINLITNAGIVGGGMIGEMNGSTMYNCEFRGGFVVCNATAGVSALGGQPLYMGALVGGMNDSTIEYCRVTDVINEDGSRTYTSVKNQYELAVNVAQYSEIFTGGIAGMMEGEDTGSKIVDSYSTADVYGWVKTDFAIGLGLGWQRPYTGGVVGIVRSPGDGENVIARTSYAGNLHSYAYNIVLLGIPAIEEDKWLGGITGRGGNNATISSVFFDRSASSTTNEIYAVKTTYDGGNNGDIDGAYADAQDRYENRDFWESKGFDFSGDTLRNEGYDFTDKVSDSEWAADHYNRWAMDYERGIPVHAGSIAATMDFPGSGTVSIYTSGVLHDGQQIGDALTPKDKAQNTSDPYDFAVAGIAASESYVNISFGMTEDAPEGSSWALDEESNPGYRFGGWFRRRDVRFNDIEDRKHDAFTSENGMLAKDGLPLLDDRNRVSGFEEETVYLPLGDEASDDTERLEYADRDLYVAYAQAYVRFHLVDGTPNDQSDIWCDYGQELKLPSACPSVDGLSDTARLIGWTDLPLEGHGAAGYEAITSTDLADLKASGHFFETDATYTVTEPTNLYPVYSDYISNVSVVYEGNERDSNENVAVREMFGEAKVSTNADGDIVVYTETYDENPYDDSIRFLGWYENVGTDENGETIWALRYKGGDEAPNGGENGFNLTDMGVDVTLQHTYMARFEYRVAYALYADQPADYIIDWSRYEEPFHTYGYPSQNNGGAIRNMESWVTGAGEDGQSTGDAIDASGPGHVVMRGDDEGYDGEPTPVRYPLTVHGHWANDDLPTADYVVATTDFPGSGTTSVTDGATGVTVDVNINDGYTLQMWASERENEIAGNHNQMTSEETPFKIGTISLLEQYWAEAAMTADVTFDIPYSSEGETTDYTVQRQYGQSVFSKVESPAPDTRYVYYHYTGGRAGEFKTAPTSDQRTQEPYGYDMSRVAQSATQKGKILEGYAFIGWVDKTELTAGEVKQNEWNWVFEDGKEITANGVTIVTAEHADRVRPYIIDDPSFVCLRATELMPVYVPISIKTDTNVHIAGVPDGYNQPKAPGLADGDDNGATTYHYVPVNYKPSDLAVIDGYSCPVNIDYDASGKTRVTIGVDESETFIKGSDGDTYELVSVTCELGDGSSYELQRNEDGTYSDEIYLGNSYLYVANYEPLPIEVRYHLSDTNIETHTAEVGGVLPSPDGKAAWTNEPWNSEFHVGWTEGTEPVDYSADPVMLEPGVTRLNKSIDVAPVYRAANVDVKSNIDDPLSSNDFRRAVKRSGDEGLWLEADAVDGYNFIGWSNNYVSDESYEVVYTNSEARLTGDARFDGTTWTAVYEQSYEVVYHGVDGKELTRIGVSKDETLAAKMQSEEGASEEWGINPSQLPAFTAIQEALSEKNSEEGANAQELFITWQRADGSARWNSEEGNFSQKLISDLADTGTHELHLYPVTYRFTAQDSNGDEYGSNLVWSITTDENDKPTVKLTLKSDYKQPTMVVHVDEVSYTEENANGSEQGLIDVPVSLYPSDGSGYLLAQAATYGANAPQDYEQGDALLALNGILEITKSTSDDAAAGQSFAFVVVDSNKESRVVNVELGESKGSDGHYSGTVKLTLPYGEYTVSEDTGWAWRYGASLQAWDSEKNDWGTNAYSVFVSISYLGTEAIGEGEESAETLIPARVKATNTRTNDRWLDSNDMAHNVFGTTTTTNSGKDGE